MKNFYQNLRSGFTLIELLVVVAIISILSAIAAPAFQLTVTKFRVTSELTDLSGDLQYARSEASRQGVPVIICPSSDLATCATTSNWNTGKTGGTGWIVGTANAAGDNVTGRPLRARGAWESTDTLASDNPTPFLVTFTRDGFATGLPTSGTVVFTLTPTKYAANAGKCVTLTKAGRQATLLKGTAPCN